MPKFKYRPKRDDNEKEIVIALEKLGFSVQQLSIDNVPDLLVYNSIIDRTFLVEIKNPKTYGKLTEGQSKWIENWKGDVVIAYSIHDIFDYCEKKIREQCMFIDNYPAALKDLLFCNRGK